MEYCSKLDMFNLDSLGTDYFYLFIFKTFLYVFLYTLYIMKIKRNKPLRFY